MLWINIGTLESKRRYLSAGTCCITANDGNATAQSSSNVFRTEGAVMHLSGAKTVDVGLQFRMRKHRRVLYQDRLGTGQRKQARKRETISAGNRGNTLSMSSIGDSFVSSAAHYNVSGGVQIRSPEMREMAAVDAYAHASKIEIHVNVK